MTNLWLDEDLADLWRRARPLALERIAVVRRAAEATVAPGDQELEAVQYAAHKLAGSLGMFGLARSSVLAQQLNQIVEECGLATPDARRRVLLLAGALHKTVGTAR